MLSVHQELYLLLYPSSFVVKQKAAYEIEYGLVGSEMCIRDRFFTVMGDSFSKSFTVMSPMEVRILA